MHFSKIKQLIIQKIKKQWKSVQFKNKQEQMSTRFDNI